MIVYNKELPYVTNILIIAFKQTSKRSILFELNIVIRL